MATKNGWLTLPTANHCQGQLKSPELLSVLAICYMWQWYIYIYIYIQYKKKLDWEYKHE